MSNSSFLSILLSSLLVVDILATGNSEILFQVIIIISSCLSQLSQYCLQLCLHFYSNIILDILLVVIINY